MAYKIGTKEKPMVLKTPPLTSEYTMHVDEKDGKEILAKDAVADDKFLGGIKFYVKGVEGKVPN
jgi:hypothetical protein